jgi:hypothetical protein
MTWVTDLSHFIVAETGDLPRNVPGPARRLMEHLTKIVAAATTAAANQDHARDQIKCRRRPRHRACRGIIDHHVWADERISWRCPRCGGNGVISNWQSTACDRRLVRAVH